ncbi:hypothetical protein ACPUYX_09945 [Desulfosporosinus sp. SYSU MS00001]|uniref:hypothetical protein n=1 Tax=Desulfosporosinus sp. SYSU MS00001 TaxID=3416284 RepID=UPI003CE6A4F7
MLNSKIQKLIRNKQYLVFGLLLILMLLIHRYIFLYADDLYYSRDASYGLSYLPHFVVKELIGNGRVWVGVAMLFILKYNIYVFRIFNPVVIALTAFLITKISTSSSGCNNTLNKQRIVIASLCSSLFFVFLPIEIANTTIYYAACAFNYLYPTTLVLLYGYTLHKHYEKAPDGKFNIWILILAFIVGSSVQQVGMIGIGYTVLISAYYRFYQRLNNFKSFIPYYIALIGGYCIVSYGSIHRMQFEKQTGHAVNFKAVTSSLIKTNIFSYPVSGYVLILSLCCVFWMLVYKNQLPNKIITLCNNILMTALSFGILGYIYVVFYKKYDIHLFTGGLSNTLLSICLLGFAAVYLISLIYLSILILIKRHYPFLLYNSINAIGSQLMLFVVDARFAEAYKIIFPALLLMTVFVVYSIINFYKNKLFLILLVIFESFSLAHLGKFAITYLNHSYNVNSSYTYLFITFVIFAILAIIVGHYKIKNFRGLAATAIILLGLFNFGTEYYGYQLASYAQNYNMKAIKVFHLNHNSSELTLKKTPRTIYGYNVANWNTMPYFMKECYHIPEKTAAIKYIE